MQPRIKISYDIEENGALIKKELPFTIGVIADFSGNNSQYATTEIQSREFIPITLNSVDKVMGQVKPGLSFSIKSDTLTNKEMDIKLQFSSLDDFKPESLINQIPELSTLKKLRDQLKQQQIQQDSNTSEPPNSGILDKAKQILSQYLGNNNVI